MLTIWSPIKNEGTRYAKYGKFRAELWPNENTQLFEFADTVEALQSKINKRFPAKRLCSEPFTNGQGITISHYYI